MRGKKFCYRRGYANTAAPRGVHARRAGRLIAPRSIAVVGASPRPSSFGLRTIENLAHYAGEVYPVNAKYEAIAGRRCYGSLAALPQSPDCVVLVVPRDGVEAALEEAAAAGAGGAIVYASGYGELAREEAAAAQLRLAAIARAAKMPMLGPNCMGLVNNAFGAGMTFIPDYRACRAMRARSRW
jgi:acetate---CoA ligase (ADP-forming)